MKFFASPRFWLWLSLAVLPLTISNDSLWLDEGDTAMYAQEPDCSSWTHRLLHDDQADCQMPLGMFCAWVGGKILGTQEWQLRAVNLIWGALALLALYRVGCRLQLPWLPALLALQPYFWFYLNEARPYASQLACGAWLLAGLVEFYCGQGRGTGWAWQFAVASVVAFASTMLAPLPVAATVAALAFIAWREGWKPGRRAICILLGGLLACVPLAVYYLGTLMRGAKGSQMWAVDLKFVAYVFYELAGLGSLGLSGPEIRTLARSPDLLHELVARAPQLVLPLGVGVMLAAVVVFGLRRRWRAAGRSLLLGLLLVPLLVGGAFLVLSLGLQKAFWARHYAMVFPFFVAVLGLAFAGMFSGPGRWGRLFPLLVCGVLLAGALRFRFAESLRKEDYRSAAAFAARALAEQKDVWWVAGGYSAHYYGVPLAEKQPESGKVFLVWFPAVDLAALPLPDVVILSKPDVHDPTGSVRKIISENHFAPAVTYQGFTIWTNATPR